MKIGFNVDKSTFDNFVDLSSKINKTDFPPEKINSLVLDCQKNFSNRKFENLLVVVFSVYDIKCKIIETSKGGNSNFLNNDDYFSLYSEILWNCVSNYSKDIGDFKNFFIMFFHTRFLDLKKNSFFKVTGNISKEKRKNIKLINVDGFAETAGTAFDLDENLSRNDVHKYLLDLPLEQRNIINYMYFSDGKKTVKEASEHFKLSENQINYRLKNAYDTIKHNYPTALTDFMTNAQSDRIIEFPNANSFKENGSDSAESFEFNNEINTASFDLDEIA